MEALVTAANVGGLSSNVSTILVTMIGISILFVGAKYIRRATK